MKKLVIAVSLIALPALAQPPRRRQGGACKAMQGQIADIRVATNVRLGQKRSFDHLLDGQIFLYAGYKRLIEWAAISTSFAAKILSAL